MTPKLNVERQERIASFIRAGGFPHIAAEAAGLPRELFEEWMQRGKDPRSASRYRNFRVAILQAQAQARLAAETKALQEKPMDWLKAGPGRDTAETVGWASPARAHARDTDGFLDAFRHPELQRLFQTLLEVLAPFPEARGAVAAAIEQLKTSEPRA